MLWLLPMTARGSKKCSTSKPPLARVVLKADRDHKRAIMLARCRVQGMVWAVEKGPRQRKDNCGSGGCHTRHMVLSQMEEGAALDVARACLEAVTVALERSNIVPRYVAQADPTVAVALVSVVPEAVPTIPDAEDALGSIDQGL